MTKAKTNPLRDMIKTIAEQVFNDLHGTKSPEGEGEKPKPHPQAVVSCNGCIASSPADCSAICPYGFYSKQQPPRAFENWSRLEDNELRLELGEAIKRIARKHKRSEGAIKTRINKKFIVDIQSGQRVFFPV